LTFVSLCLSFLEFFFLDLTSSSETSETVIFYIASFLST
jgi:hypothetical protein